jgi:hypothetical protein
MLFVVASPAAAGSGTDGQVIVEPVSFSIPAGQCPLLPAGLSVSGTGERHATIHTKNKAGGIVEVRINDVIKGTATDSRGRVHNFVYRNSSTQTIRPSGFTTISMNDLFTLTGPGPHYSVSFNWRWTFTQPDLWPPDLDNLVQFSGDDPELVFACDPL